MSDQPGLGWVKLAKKLERQQHHGLIGFQKEPRELRRKIGGGLEDRDWSVALTLEEKRFMELLFREACDDWEVPILTGYTHAEFREALDQFLAAHPEII